MSTFVSNRDAGGLTNEEGHFRLPLKIWQGDILDGLEVIQNASPAPDMTVTVTKGDAKITYNDYSYAVWTDGDEEDIAVDTADGVNNRQDRVVAYVDRGLTYDETDTNNPEALKFKVVAGTPAASPSLPNNTVVQNAVGVGNPWIEIAILSVPSNSTSVVTARITDTRTFLKSAAITRAMYPVGSIYINAQNSENPGTIFGFGTWVEFGSGKVPVGVDTSQAEFNTAGATGGSKENTHTHWTGVANDGAGRYITETTGIIAGGGRTRVLTKKRSMLGGSSVTSSTREDSTYPETISILQPYINVYMWHRTA